MQRHPSSSTGAWVCVVQKHSSFPFTGLVCQTAKRAGRGCPELAGSSRVVGNLDADVSPRKRTMLFMVHLLGPPTAGLGGEPDRLGPTDARPADRAGGSPGCCDNHPAAAGCRNRTATRVAVHWLLDLLFRQARSAWRRKACPSCHGGVQAVNQALVHCNYTKV